MILKPILHPVVCRFAIPGYTALMKLIAPKRWHKSVDGNLRCKQHLRTMIGRITRFWNIPPLNALGVLTLIALIPRLVAAVLSQGYFAHDDHFLIIDAAGSWVNGFDYNDWLPWNQGADPTPSGHSFFYVGLHYLLFSGLKAIGITDPKTLMIVVRLLHALWSLIVVRAGYRIALRLGDAVIAWRTGLFLALFCFMPFLAVRNLVEVACIPFLMLGAWRLIRSTDGPTWKDALIAGVWIGLAMNVRFQTIFFAVGPGLALLFQRRWMQAFSYGAGVLIPLGVIQGGIDFFLWGRPFAELTQYVMYNLANTTTYGVLPWYNYLLLLAGIFIPPLSLAVLFGFFRRTSPLLLWLPVFLFLAIHSYFPNKQERFLLPIVPLFFVLGFVAWEQWRNASQWWSARIGLWRGGLVFAWSINLLLLPVLSTTYSKRSRVEALYSLRAQGPITGLILDDTEEDSPPLPPLFYLGQWGLEVIPWGTAHANDHLGAYLDSLHIVRRPDIVLFMGDDHLDERMERMRTDYGDVTEIGRAEPGLIDRTVHWLNPVNRNETIVIARVRPRPPAAH
ncbi:MAG: glycosyltransferase family 39 protein [Flavobacteriales bacterium]|nr:glycosyltransferase family 39 protein [Flavobacteriales bacterium]MCC6937537.1 glycosyltransferase family 39 protein [Flavobacteriales bacterium]